MKVHLWSNSKIEWEGFQPVAYWLDIKALQLPLEKSESSSSDTQITFDKQTTVGEVFDQFKDKQLKQESLSGFGLYTELETTDGLTLQLKGKHFNRRILEMMLDFRAEGVNPFEVSLFYYDKDSCRNDPQDSYRFFAVHNNKIVRERLAFSDYHDSGFDPLVFERADHSHPTWFDEEAWDEAQLKFWYRKFYSETRTGQLMALRPDSPFLFYYDRTGPDIMGALATIARNQNTVRLLLWALLILAILNFILRWK